MSSFAVLLPAAGRSTRFNDKEKKPFATLDGRAVWLRTAELFINRTDVAECFLIINPDDEERFRTRYAANLAFMNIKLVHGGRERFDSVANGLAKLSPDVKLVAIHDAVPMFRPTAAANGSRAPKGRRPIAFSATTTRRATARTCSRSVRWTHSTCTTRRRFRN
jgi:2-C-methyl-D-erythritol 4-phosphate cytidylyltransferase